MTRTNATLLLLSAVALAGVVWVGARSTTAAAPLVPDAIALHLHAVEQPAGTDARAPSFSPKGVMIAFEAWRDGAPQVLVSLMGHAAPTDHPVAVPLRGQAPDAAVRQPVWHPEPKLFVTGAAEAGERLWFVAPGPGHDAVPLLSAELAPGLQSDAQVCSSGLTLLWLSEVGVQRWQRGRDEQPVTVLAGADLHGLSAAARCDRVLTARGEQVVMAPIGEGETTVLSEAGRGVVFVGDQPVWFERAGEAWQLRLGEAGAILADDVALPPSERPGVAEDGDWVLWSRPDGGGLIWAYHLPDQREVVLDTSLEQVGDLDVAQGFGQTWLAVTGRAKDSLHDGLFVVQLTEALGPPASESP